MDFGGTKKDRRNLFQKAWDQVNPLDNNRTFKQAAPTATNSGWKDAERVAGNVFRGSARGVNTAVNQAAQVSATARMIAATQSNNPNAFRNASRYADEVNERFKRGEGGLLGVGTFYDAEEAKRGDLATGVKRIGGGMTEAATELASLGLAGFTGKQVFGQGAKHIGRNLVKQAPNLGKNYLLNTVQGGSAAFNDDASARDIALSAAIAGPVGTVADAAIGTAGYGINQAVIKPVRQGIEEFMAQAGPAAGKFLANESAPTPGRVKVESTVTPSKGPVELDKVSDFKRTQIDQDEQLLSYARKMDRERPRDPNAGLTWEEEVLFRTNQQRSSDRTANVVLEEDADFKMAASGLDDAQNAEFSAYANARAELAHIKSKKTASGKQKAVRSSAPIEELEAMVAAGSRVYGERFAALNQFNKTRANDLYKSGIISKAQLDDYAKRDDYVRIQRDMDELFQQGGGGGSSMNLGSTSTKQKFKGSTRDMKDTLQVAAERNQQIQKEIARNETGKSIVKMLREGGQARRVSETHARNHNTMTVWQNGKKVYYEVPKEISEVVANINPFQITGIMKIVAGMNRVFRATTTGINPAFALVANPIRDQFSSAVFSKNVARTHNPANWTRGVGNGVMDALDMNGNPLYKEFRKIYGDMTSYDLMRNAQTNKEAVARIRGGAPEGVKQKIKHPVRTIEDFASISEKATRYQNFKGMYDQYSKNMSHELAVEKAAIDAWQNSVDFARAGTWGRTLNLLFPYWNPAIQGTRQLFRAGSQRPMQTGIQATAFVGVPMMAAAAWNAMNTERREEYEKVPEWEKENNLIIFPPGPAGELVGMDGNDYIKVPLPQGIKDVFMPFRRAIDAYYSEDPIKAQDIAQDVLQLFAGPIQTGSLDQLAGSVIPQAVKPTVQAMTNKDFFTGNNIESAEFDEWNVPAGERSYNSTSGTTKQVGGALGVSPIKTEKWIKDTVGEVGLLGLNAVDNIQAKLRGDKWSTAENESDFTIGGRGIKESVSRRLAGTTEDTRSAGAKWYAKLEDNMKTVDMDPNDKAAWKVMNPQKKDITGKEVYSDDNLYDADKRLALYNDHPKTYELDKLLDAQGRAEGKPGNPLFDLSFENVRKVLEKEAMPPGSKDPELTNLYTKEWYATYQAEKSVFFDKLKATAEAEGRPWATGANPYPVASKELQAVMDQYNALPKGTGERSNFIRHNKDSWNQMTAHWGAIDTWQNNKRGQLGLDATEGDVGGANGYTAYTQDSGSGYSSYGGGGGSEQPVYDSSAKYIRRYAIDGDVPSGKGKSGKRVRVKAAKRKAPPSKKGTKSSKIRLA